MYNVFIIHVGLYLSTAEIPVTDMQMSTNAPFLFNHDSTNPKISYLCRNIYNITYYGIRN